MKENHNRKGANAKLFGLVLLACLVLTVISLVVLDVPMIGTPEATKAPTIHPPVEETPAPWSVLETPEATPQRPANMGDSQVTEVAERTQEAPEITTEPTIAEIAPFSILDVPLDKETQWAIYSLCEDDAGMFCALMAIARVESSFDPNAVGDGGRSVGLMQINYALHTARIERLGITNLYDPVQSATVAADYLKELAQEFNVGTGDHVLYMAYNKGPTGARQQFSRGVYSNAYTWTVMSYYDSYMEEMLTRA